MPIIIGMPPIDIIMGMPMPIMLIMRLQPSMNISMDMPFIGIISHIMPLSVMVQVILAIIIGIIAGIMPFIIGIIPPIGIIPFIMEFIPPIIGFMPIIGIMAGIGIIDIALLIFKLRGRLDGRAVHDPHLGPRMTPRNDAIEAPCRFLRQNGRASKRLENSSVLLEALPR